MVETTSSDRAPRRRDRPSDSAGWYAFGPAGRAARWDGQAWTGQVRQAPDIEALPATKRHRFGFLTHRWFSLFMLGWVVTALGAVLGTEVPDTHWWWLMIVAIGLAISVYGFLLIFEPHLRFSQLTDIRTVIVAGLVSGAAAYGIAYLIEVPLLKHRLDVGLLGELTLAGPVEETAKLLVPLLMWIFVASRFRNPRAGLLTVLISGATFGVGEGIEYIARDGHDAHLLMAILRPLAEAAHPVMTAIAASLIWLAAYRSRRLVTVAGLVGWVVAMVLHSAHDMPGDLGRGSGGTAADGADVAGMGIVGNLFSLVWLVLVFCVLRHVARELAPPSAAVDSPPQWRPRITQWGVRDQVMPADRSES
ncbi:PrsW family glutamic-type intramembrane protease [Rhodococcus sp. NPDC060086]|uniref:PrsW family glutamic-type intramembrane protease n=1 Tax=Rhodococcus sp. NPDC060086 TaxID=3347055 RepID=UPI0036668783